MTRPRRHGHAGRTRPTQERDNHGHQRPCPDRPPAHRGADRARGEALNERTQRVAARCTSARTPAARGGVASSYQLRDPWPIYLERGNGPKVWDVDGNEMWDFHNGFGSMVQGHAHPAIGAAISERYASGTHFAAPTEDAIVVGEELARRWGLPKWRYTNSGSESTMDAIRIARALHGPRHDR